MVGNGQIQLFSEDLWTIQTIFRIVRSGSLFSNEGAEPTEEQIQAIVKLCNMIIEASQEIELVKFSPMFHIRSLCSLQGMRTSILKRLDLATYLERMFTMQIKKKMAQEMLSRDGPNENHLKMILKGLEALSRLGYTPNDEGLKAVQNFQTSVFEKAKEARNLAGILSLRQFMPLQPIKHDLFRSAIRRICESTLRDFSVNPSEFLELMGPILS